MPRLSPRLTFSNVISVIALFIALGGGAMAAVKLKTNSVKAKQIAPGAVGTSEAADDAITGADISGLTGADISGLTGADVSGLTGADVNDNSLGGPDIDEGTVRGLVGNGATIPSGVTVTGAAVFRDASSTSTNLVGVSFPLPAPAPPTSVNCADDFTDVCSDEDAACTGGLNTPTAPAGKVCIYIDTSWVVYGGTAPMAGSTVTGGASDADRRGFKMESTVDGTVDIVGTWAYTAP